MKQNQLSIEEVKSHFEQWRATRIKRGKIPVHLWDMVKQIINHYSLTTITKELRINTNQLQDNPDRNPPINFVKVRTNIAPPLLNHALTSPTDDLQTCSIELHHTNGGMLKDFSSTSRAALFIASRLMSKSTLTYLLVVLMLAPHAHINL